MDNTDKIVWTLLVVMFLLNTSRVLQATELWHECLILLSNTAAKEQVVELAYRGIYAMLFQAYYLLRDHPSAINCGRKLLDILRSFGLRAEEGEITIQLAKLYRLQGKYKEAKRIYKKALSIMKETGDREGEARCYENLGTVYLSIGEHAKADEYLNNALAIQRQLGNKTGEAMCYGNLGIFSQSLSEYGKAEEYQRKALAITREIGDREGEAAWYGNLGTVYFSRGQYAKAKEYLNNALALQRQLGDKTGEAVCYGNLGSVSSSVGEYGKAEEYQRKALAIRREIGDRQGEATCYGNLGIVYLSRGQYAKAEEYQRKALAIRREIGNREGEATSYGYLGTLFRSLGKHPEAKQYHEKAVDISREINDIRAEAMWHLQLAYDAISEGNIGLKDQILSNLFASVNKCEKIRSFFGGNDQFKISLIEHRSDSYHLLGAMLGASGNEKDAICVLELARARALADLISVQHSAQQQVSVNAPSWADIERILKKESNCSCLYISYLGPLMYLAALKGNKPIHFRQINVNECFFNKRLERNADQVFSEESFRRFNVLSQEQCEDRSLTFLKASTSTPEPAEEESLTVYRPVEEEEEENLELLPTLAERYKMIIAPVADLLDQRELVIVPDRVLYKVPFAALMDESEIIYQRLTGSALFHL